MELADRLQTLKPPRQSVRKIPKQRVDELLQVVPLVGPHGDKVIEDFVVAPCVELAFKAATRSRPGRGEAERSSEQMWGGLGLGMAALYRNVHRGSNVTHNARS